MAGQDRCGEPYGETRLRVRVREFHQGRLLDHVHLRVADLEASRAFYRAILEALGLSLTWESESAFSADELFVSDDGEPTSGLHLAFQAADREAVGRFYDAALAAGGRDNGRPGERDYHPGYYAAYVFDPDGNNVEAVFHGPSERSAPSVVIRPAEP
jgi:catechol 2,3-dioxygenase-like lactoylglutathione lyase family enzyme